MAIDLQSLSITSAFNSIVNFFKSQENNTKWRDLTTGSEGSFLIRLLANIVSTLSYRVVAQSRENFISTLTLPSSGIGISVNLGYSTFRGSNLKRLMRITPTGDYVFPKLSVIGKYNEEYDIITLDDVALKKGVDKDVKTVVGKIKEETITAGTSAIKVFSLFTTGISEDFTLYLGSQEVPTTNVIKQLVYDKYLVRTNPYSSVDILYLNTYPNFKYKYGTGSEITIRYVELSDVNEIPYDTSMFTCGTLKDTSNISSYMPAESVSAMKVNAPLDHELQNLIRSKVDYANRLKEVIPTITESDYRALTPTYTLITYLKDNLSLLTTSEKKEVENVLKEENFFGTPLPDITVPRREVANLKIDIALLDKYKNISDIEVDVDNILKNFYNYSLALKFSTYNLERAIENLSYVRYARVSHKINKRQNGTNYQIGYVLNHQGNSYIASKILGLSGSTPPNWNVPLGSPRPIDTGLETVDGNIRWRTFKKLPNMSNSDLSMWRPNFRYGIGEYVYTDTFPNYMFKVVDLIKSSGPVEPNLKFMEPKEFIVDGSVVWVTKKKTDAPMWKSFTNYSLGDCVNSVTSSELTLECISYTGTSGTEDNIEFELANYKILGKTANTFSVKGDKTFYFRKGDVISVSSNVGYTSFSVSNSVFDSSVGRTIISVYQNVDPETDYGEIITELRGTRDGQILWTLIDDITDIQYNWNSYVTFDYEVNVIEGGQ